MIKKIIDYFKKRKEWNTVRSTGRLPNDPPDVEDRLIYRGVHYVKMYPQGVCVTEGFYNWLRPNNIIGEEDRDEIYRY